MSGPALTGGFRQLLEVNVRTLSNGPKCISKFAPHLIARRENKDCECEILGRKDRFFHP
jgi:hypothetical protein